MFGCVTRAMKRVRELSEVNKSIVICLQVEVQKKTRCVTSARRVRVWHREKETRRKWFLNVRGINSLGTASKDLFHGLMYEGSSVCPSVASCVPIIFVLLYSHSVLPKQQRLPGLVCIVTGTTYNYQILKTPLAKTTSMGSVVQDKSEGGTCFPVYLKL